MTDARMVMEGAIYLTKPLAHLRESQVSLVAVQAFPQWYTLKIDTSYHILESKLPSP